MRTALQKHPCKSQINVHNNIDDIHLGGEYTCTVDQVNYLYVQLKKMG